MRMLMDRFVTDRDVDGRCVYSDRIISPLDFLKQF